MADDWAFKRSKLPLPTYLKCSTPEETVKERHIACSRIGKKYDPQSFCQDAIAQQDIRLIKHLVEKESVDIFKCKYTKSTGIGRKKRISPLEYAERKKWPEFLQYVRSLSKAPGADKNRDDDEPHDSQSYADTSEGGVSEDSSGSSLSPSGGSSQFDVETFRHDQDYHRIDEVFQALLTKLPNEKHQFLHWVEMSMVSLIDKKRAVELAPKACWLMCSLLAIFRYFPENPEFIQQAIDFWRSIGAVPPFTAVKYDDLNIYYASHPFVVLVTADVGMGTEARERANSMSSFLRIIVRFHELYAAHFPPEELEAGHFNKFQLPAPISSSSGLSLSK